MKKFLIRWLVLGLGIIGIVVLFFIFKKDRTSQVCQEFEIEFRDNATPFISKSEIQKYLAKDTIRFVGQRIDEIDLSKIESALNQNPYIQNADCYIRMNGLLVIDIAQKTPVLRVIPLEKPSYYLDENGDPFPLSARHTSDVKVATGHIKPSLNTKLYTFTSYVNQSTFWNSLIEQIFVRPNGDLIFTTQMGGHEVVVGDNDRLEQKLQKLEQFYQRASTNLGWEKYREINLKFKDQVICKK
jgi:cell division protein FtsQ